MVCRWMQSRWFKGHSSGPKGVSTSSRINWEKPWKIDAKSFCEISHTWITWPIHALTILRFVLSVEIGHLKNALKKLPTSYLKTQSRNKNYFNKNIDLFQHIKLCDFLDGQTNCTGFSKCIFKIQSAFCVFKLCFFLSYFAINVILNFVPSQNYMGISDSPKMTFLIWDMLCEKFIKPVRLTWWGTINLGYMNKVRGTDNRSCCPVYFIIIEEQGSINNSSEWCLSQKVYTDILIKQIHIGHITLITGIPTHSRLIYQ